MFGPTTYICRHLAPRIVVPDGWSGHSPNRNMPAPGHSLDVGRIIETLANPYGIATLFGLDADEIRTRLAPLFERFGWDRDSAVSEADRGSA